MGTNLYYKKLLLAIISPILTLIFINIDVNKYFLFERTLDNLDNIMAIQDENIEYQKNARYGGQYYACRYVKKYCEEKGLKDPIILFEPNTYYTQNKIRFKAPEPIIFYYFTGLKGVWMDSKNIGSASLFVMVTNDNFSVVTIESKEQLDEIINTYKKYKPSL